MKPFRTLSRRLFRNFASLSILLILLMAARSAPAEVKSPFPSPARIKAVQVLILEESTMEELPNRLSVWKEAGFDTVILRAFHLAGDRPHGPSGKLVDDRSEGVYFPTNQARVIMDLMSPFAAMCHEQGLKAFAWMVTRDARFDNAGLPMEMVYDPPSNTTRPIPRLDVMDPVVLDYLDALFTDLARTGIDGILLQDDLSSRMVEGFTEGSIQRYLRETGASVGPHHHLKQVTAEDGRNYLNTTPGFDHWIGWKTQQLVHVARRLQETVEKAVPGTTLAMNQMYETLTDPANGRLWLSQDLTISLMKGPFYAALMLYHKQMQDELGIGPAETFDLIAGSLNELPGKVDTSRVILKFQTIDWVTGKAIPAPELLRALKTARDGRWSLTFVPPPTEKQMEAITPVLRGM